MSDPSLNYYVAIGDTAARTAFTPVAATPAAGPSPLHIWYDTDLNRFFTWFGAAWEGASAAYSALLADIAGASFSQGDVIYYNGANLVRLAAGTNGHFLKTQGAGANPVWAAATASLADADYGDVVVTTSGTVWTVDNNVISDAKLRDSAALTVIGRSANSTGDPADIAAANDGEVLRRSGTSLGFGTIATAGIANSAVTLAKIANAAASSKLLGAGAAGSGAAYAELSLGTALSMSGTTLNGIQPAQVLITETVTSASQASVTFSSIPNTYRDLEIRVRGRGSTAATNIELRVQFNGDTAGNYDYAVQTNNGAVGQAAATTYIFAGYLTGSTSLANAPSNSVIKVFDYRGTTFYKGTMSELGVQTASGSIFTGHGEGQWRSTSAITSALVFPASGNFVDNTVVSLYGVM